MAVDWTDPINWPDSESIQLGWNSQVDVIAMINSALNGELPENDIIKVLTINKEHLENMKTFPWFDTFDQSQLDSAINAANNYLNNN